MNDQLANFKNILLVDDDHNVSQMLKLLLETRGYQVSIANSGRSALEKANNSIDIILLDLVPVMGPGGGIFGSEALEAAGITANKNTIPKDPSSPFYPSGVRLGTPALTTRGMKEREMAKIGEWIARVVHEVCDCRLPKDPTERSEYLKMFKKELARNKNLKQIREEIRKFCKKFPVPSAK